jgi:protein O-GlcNAc transferase
MSGTAVPILDQMRDRARQLFLGRRFTEAAAAYRGILAVVPGDFDAVHHMGQVAIQLGHLEEARKLLDYASQLDPSHAEVRLHHGMALQHLGRTDEAVESFQRALELKPNYSEAQFCLAVTQKNAGRIDQALESFDHFLSLRGDQPAAFLHRGSLLHQKADYAKALADFESALTLKPDYLEAWLFRGVLLNEQGRSEEALACYDKAAAIAPERGDLWYNRGVALQDLGRDQDAMESYDRSVRFSPDFPDAWNNRAVLLHRVDRHDDALVSVARALALKPDHIQALNNQGSILTSLRRFDEAMVVYDRALAVSPDGAQGWYNCGVALHNTGRPRDALDAYDKAIALDPRLTDAWNNRGNLLREDGRYDEAMASFVRAIEIDPGHVGTVANIGGNLQDTKHYAQAAGQFRKLETLSPDHKYLLGGRALSALMLCDWETLEAVLPRLDASVRSGRSIIPPFSLLGMSDDAALHRIAARYYFEDSLSLIAAQPRPAIVPHARIRLAYVSNDFHAHATARLMSDLFERHDRARFEVIAISFGPDEAGPVRNRLKKAFDQFHDVEGKSDAEIAALMKQLEVDIAVDLKVYTERARPGVFVLRPAPVQVNYLGYPGTMGTDILDYVIADPVALPFDQQPYYSEQIVHLPDSYQCNDPARTIGAVPSRREAGLPETGFVFVCFNNHWKITAPLFAGWMRLLAAVPDSVLWLLDDTGTANLRRQAQAHGIDPARLIFAPKLPHDDHLGRLSLADLALDTLIYNAHTTASDALWTGVPMVTLLGKTFAGRVGASLLTAVSLSELIAADLAGYEALAIKFATDANAHQALKAKLAANRLTQPLFDAPRFVRHIEAAYVTMMQKARAGEAPGSFSVPAQA